MHRKTSNVASEISKLGSSIFKYIFELLTPPSPIPDKEKKLI